MDRIRFWLLIALVFMIPWENAVTITGVGTLIKITGVAVAVVWAITTLPRMSMRKPDKFHVAMFLFVLWNAASLLWTFNPEFTLQRVITLSQLFVMVYIIWDLTRSRAELRMLLQAYVLGSWVTISSSVVNFVRGQDVNLRFTGAELNANDLTVILALAMPVAWHLATNEDGGKGNWFLKFINYACIPAGGFAIALSGTRTGIFVMAPALMYMIATSKRLRISTRIVVFTLLAGAAVALYPHIPSGIFDRFGTTGSSIAAGDFGGRGRMWREGLKEFASRPILGAGAGAFGEGIPPIRSVVHNSFISVLAESGIPGFLFFMSVVTIACLNVMHQQKPLRGVWLSVVVIWAIGASTLTWEHRKPTWLFLGLVVVSSNLSLTKRS